MSTDYISTALLVITLVLVSVAYAIRMVVRGRAHFDRVERHGGSVLLGKGLMEMAYWSLQPIGKLLVKLKITPNMISWLSLVLGGVSAVFLAYGYFGSGALFAALSAFLDTLDGMVARMTGKASDAGEVLDACVDRYVEFFFLSGLVIYYQSHTGFQLLALAALIGSFMISYSTAKAEALQVPPPPGIMRRPERAFYLILGAALSPLFPASPDIDFSAHTPLPMLFAVMVIAVLSNISAIERFYTIALAIRQREETEAEKAEALSKAAQVENKTHWTIAERDTVAATTNHSDFRQ